MRLTAIIALAGLFGVGIVALFNLDHVMARWLADRRRRRERGGWLL